MKCLLTFYRFLIFFLKKGKFFLVARVLIPFLRTKPGLSKGIVPTFPWVLTKQSFVWRTLNRLREKNRLFLFFCTSTECAFCRRTNFFNSSTFYFFSHGVFFTLKGRFYVPFLPLLTKVRFVCVPLYAKRSFVRKTGVWRTRYEALLCKPSSFSITHTFNLID